MISEIHAKCENAARCGKLGHYVKDGEWTDCPCTVSMKQRQSLGEFYCDEPKMYTPLINLVHKNLILIGTRADVVSHVAGAFLHLEEKRRKWVSVTSERLLEIWLGNDEDGVRTFVPLERCALAFLWLGWGERLPNKCRPDAIHDLLGRRARVQRPLWVYMNFDYGDVAQRYSSAELVRQLDEFEQIELE